QGPPPTATPEAAHLPIPKKLAQAGVKDMVRISDARMSGTAFGTIVLHITPESADGGPPALGRAGGPAFRPMWLHITPESADGGPLGLVRAGHRIRLDVPKRSLQLLVDDAEL